LAEVDTARTVELKASASGVLAPILLGMAMTGVCVALVVVYAGAGNPRQYMGMAGTALFGAITIVSIWRSSKIGDTVLTLSPQGFRDIRVSPEFIPWSAVESISAREMSSAKGVVVKRIVVTLPKSVRQNSRFGRSGGWSQSGGADGLSIATEELGPPFNEILEMMRAYLAAHGGKAA
jgi:hypothetical protein